jgi:hypothetical protein
VDGLVKATSLDGEEETRQVDAALDRVNARLAPMDARLDAIDARLDRLTRRLCWWGLWWTRAGLVGFGLVAWWRVP